MKKVIPSNIVDKWTRIEVLLGLNVSGYTDTFTEASTKLNDFCKEGDLQNKQQYRNALDSVVFKRIYQLSFQSKRLQMLHQKLKRIY